MRKALRNIKGTDGTTESTPGKPDVEGGGMERLVSKQSLDG